LNIPQSDHPGERKHYVAGEDSGLPTANSVMGAAVAITLLLQMLQNPAEQHGSVHDTKVQHIRRNITGIGQTRV